MSTSNTTQKKTAKVRRSFTAKEKCESVLAVWSERRKPAEICRELNIPWQQLDNWQKSAMKGMLNALEPRRTKGQERPPSLSPRVEKLLEKTELQQRRRSRTEARLESIQKTQPSVGQS